MLNFLLLISDNNNDNEVPIIRLAIEISWIEYVSSIVFSQFSRMNH